MAHLFWLSDEAWAVFEPHLPRGLPGKLRVDDLRVISGHPAYAEDRVPVARCAVGLWATKHHLQPLHALGPPEALGSA